MYDGLMSGEVVERELLNVHKNGEVFPVHLYLTSILDERGRAIGLLSLAQDITKRKWTEEALKESEKKYRTLVETAFDSIIVLDSDGNFVFVNKQYCNMLGYSKDGLLVKNFADTLSGCL